MESRNSLGHGGDGTCVAPVALAAMGKLYDGITDSLASWIERQHVFFVATAASSAEGTVNVSPKGTEGTLVVIDSSRLAYLDLTGSGIETVAHVRENSRITLMWCAFEGPARIVRVHGSGRVVTPADDDWERLSPHFTPSRGSRAIIEITAKRVSDSCGYAVPFMDYVADRTRLDEWVEARSDEELADYRRQKNARSIDGLPGL